MYHRIERRNYTLGIWYNVLRITVVFLAMLTVVIALITGFSHYDDAPKNNQYIEETR